MFCHFTFTLQFLSYEWVIRLWMPHIFCKLQSRNIRHYYFDLFSILWFAGHAIPHLLFTASLKCRDGAEWANSQNIPGCERSGSCITVPLFSGQWRLKFGLTVLTIFPSSLKNNRKLYFVICSKGNSVENEEWWYNFCFLKFQWHNVMILEAMKIKAVVVLQTKWDGILLTKSLFHLIHIWWMLLFILNTLVFVSILQKQIPCIR